MRTDRQQSGGGAAVVVAGFLALVLAACGGTEVQSAGGTTEVQGPKTAREALMEINNLPSRKLARPDYYRGALLQMDNEERLEFFAKRDDYGRDQFLRRIGADARFDLVTLLKRKMPRAQALQRLSAEIDDGSPLYTGPTEMRTFRRFNGQGYTHIYVTFRDALVYDWGSYIDDPEEERLWKYAGEIEQQLKKILQKGDTLEHVARQYHLYRTARDKLRADFEADRIEESEEFARKLSLDMYDEQVAARELLKGRVEPTQADAQQRQPERLMILAGEPDDKVYQGDVIRWIYEKAFGERKVRYVLVFEQRRLREFYAEPVKKVYRED